MLGVVLGVVVDPLLGMVAFSFATQTVVSFSTGDAEFYAAVRGASTVLGLIRIFQDPGVTLEAPLRSPGLTGELVSTLWRSRRAAA